MSQPKAPDLGNQGIFSIPQYIMEYNRLVNSAELAICDFSYEDALKTYDSAFSCVSEPFATDKYNAAMCALLTKNYIKAKEYLAEIVAKGYDYTLLAQNTAFLKTPRRIQSKMMDVLSSVKTTYNTSVKKLYDSLFMVDQSLRKSKDYYLKYHDSLCKLDYRNGLYLVDLIGLYGFPDEPLVGVTKDLVSPLPWELIVIHNHPKPCPERVTFDMELKDALEKGHLSAFKAAKYFDETTGEGRYGIIESGLIMVQMEDTIHKTQEGMPVQFFFFNLPEKVSRRYNENRAQINMGSVDESRRKIRFNLHDRIFIFPASGKSVYSFSNKEEYSAFKENLIPVE